MGPLPAAPQTSRFPQAPPSSGGPWETMGEPVGRARSAGSERDTPHPVGCTTGLRAQPLCPTRPLRPGVTGCREVRLCPVGKPWAGRRPAGLSKRLSTTPGTHDVTRGGTPGHTRVRVPWRGPGLAGLWQGVGRRGDGQACPRGVPQSLDLGSGRAPGRGDGDPQARPSVRRSVSPCPAGMVLEDPSLREARPPALPEDGRTRGPQWVEGGSRPLHGPCVPQAEGVLQRPARRP